MKAPTLLIGTALALGIATLGSAVPAIAQQPAPAQQTPLSHSLKLSCDRVILRNRGSKETMSFQGNVRLSWFDSSPLPIPLTFAPDGLIISDPSDKKIHLVPMDMATLRISVAPSSTVFEDAVGNKLTVQTAPLPSQKP